MERNTSIVLAGAAVAWALASIGCSRGESAAAPAAPPAVSVAPAIERQVNDVDEFTGHFEAVNRVEVRPRVSGYIAAVSFTQGQEVRKGEVLFVIDQRPYAADLKRAKAQLAQARSQLELNRTERDRAVKLLQSHAISREEYDTRVAAADQSGANVDAAQATVDSASLNLEFTRVTAPFDGVVGRAETTAGNLVTAGQTLLTTLVSIDPIYVSFEGDEQAYLQYMESVRAGAHRGSDPSLVFVGLVGESDYPHQGRMVFVSNEIDPTTGTVRARGLLENHDRQFTPGMYARVELRGPERYSAVLVNDSAIGTDQSVKYVFKVGVGNKVEYRPVKLGPLVERLRVIRQGLAPGDLIVVNGLQRVRPGVPITPQRVAMGEGNPLSNGDSDARGLVARSER